MRSVPDALSLARIAPEFKTPRGIRTIGRIDGDTDIRFVANMTQTRIAGDVSFNAGEGKSPYIFDAVDGGVSPVPQWKCENGIVSIPLSLNPYESKFVVFKNGENRRIAAFAPSVNGAKKTDAVEILEAVYRSSDSPEKLDVKDFVKGDSDVKVLSRTFKCALAPGHVKELYVKYKFGGKVFEKVVREGGTIVPPVPEATRSPDLSRSFRRETRRGVRSCGHGGTAPVGRRGSFAFGAIASEECRYIGKLGCRIPEKPRRARNGAFRKTRILD